LVIRFPAFLPILKVIRPGQAAMYLFEKIEEDENLAGGLAERSLRPGDGPGRRCW
jgi:hypothetical protein